MTKLFKQLICLVLVVLCFMGCVDSTACAAAGAYTDVLSDLETDLAFDASIYPEDSEDFSLYVIQIAESSDGELFIYVYQPSMMVQATNINISIAINDSLEYTNYSLTLLSSSGVFYKYIVDDFAILSDVVRYYDISSIFRAFDESIDTATGNDNTIDYVSYEVGQLWTVITLDNEVYYGMTETETVVITDKYVGYIRYLDGVGLIDTVDKTDSHYVAFSTDHDIDRLIEADVYYISRPVTQIISGRTGLTYEYGNETENYVYLTADDVASNDGSGWWGKKYTWNRIQSVSDFISSEDLTDEVISEISNMQWVLRFTETTFESYTSGLVTTTTYIDYTEVSEVTILRLKFETDGIVYNLGVVDNMQSGSGDASNNTTSVFQSWFDSVKEWFNSLLDGLSDVIWIVVVIIGLILIAILVRPTASLLIFIFKVLWCMVSAPFRFAFWIARKIQRRRKTMGKETKKPKRQKPITDETNDDLDFTGLTEAKKRRGHKSIKLNKNQQKDREEKSHPCAELQCDNKADIEEIFKDYSLTEKDKQIVLEFLKELKEKK